MLKTFQQVSTFKNFPNTTANKKCGEIYFQSYKEITIYCTFCEMKLFEFDDFVLHLKNVHFEKNLLKLNDGELQSGNFQLELKNENVSSSDLDFNDDNQSGSGSNSEVEQTEWSKIEIVEETSDSTESKAILKKNKKRSQKFKQKICHEDRINMYDCVTTHMGKDNRTVLQHKCKLCDRCYVNKSALKVHLRRDHTVIEMQRCSECAKEFTNRRLLTAHRIKAHGGFKCPHCEKRFKYNYMLINHMPSHTGERNFKCDFESCQKSFFNRRLLTTHIRACHTGGKNFICETCGYRCHAHNTLKVHVRKHTGERPHACEICDKRFVSHSSLAEHRATHRSDRPYVCDTCGATFARQKALYHHKPLHLNEKKFKCKICGIPYAQAAGLAGHMRKHKDRLFYA